jgi:polyisoprenyl-teichoic acid--peptidoglycan teichoic acid transferase
MRPGRVILLLLLLVVVVGGGYFYLQVSQIAGGASPQTMMQMAQNPRELLGKDRIVVLIVGKDYNRDRRGIGYTKNSRSDTIMLVSLDLNTKNAAAISVPRDTFVTAPDGISGKINATFARGGVELLKGTLEQTLGIRADYHVVLKDTAVKNIVDAVGGVWVETIDFMKYRDNWGGLNIDLPAGRQFINGEQAVGFVRFREVNRTEMNRFGRIVPLRNVTPSKEEGDMRRTARQQQLLRAIAQQATTPQNLLRLNDIANVGFGELETNLTRPQMMALGIAVARNGLGGFNSMTLPGDGGYRYGAYYYDLELDKSRALVAWLLQGDESAGNKLVNVTVYNASDVAGVARATAGMLGKRGYTIQGFNTANQPQDTSVLIYKTAALEAQARAIATFLGVSDVQKNPEYPASGDVVLLMGRDLGAAMLERAASQ